MPVWVGVNVEVNPGGYLGDMGCMAGVRAIGLGDMGCISGSDNDGSIGCIAGVDDTDCSCGRYEFIRLAP